MRFYQTIERAQNNLTVDLNQVSNAVFLDYYWEGPNNTSKLMYQIDGVHFYDENTQRVSEFNFLRDYNNNQELFETKTYGLNKENGFATKKLGDYGGLMPLSGISEISIASSSLFLNEYKTCIHLQGLISSLISMNFDGIEELKWPFLSKIPQDFMAPTWMSAFIDPKSGATSLSFINGINGKLLFSFSVSLPNLEMFLASTLTASGVYASLGWYILKFLLVVAFIAVIVWAWPAIGAAAAALDAAVAAGAAVAVIAGLTTAYWAAVAGFAGAILSGLCVILDFFKEVTASSNASQAWKTKMQLAQAKLEAARAKTLAANEEKDMDKLKEAVEDQRDAQKEIKDLYDEPESESGLDQSDSDKMQGIIDETIKALEQTLATWPQ